MFETVTLEQLARMLPHAEPEDLARVLDLCQSKEGDRVLRDLVSACDCVAGAVFCTCGESLPPASAEVLETMAAVYAAGRVSRASEG
jgi:hypothetical protein